MTAQATDRNNNFSLLRLFAAIQLLLVNGTLLFGLSVYDLPTWFHRLVWGFPGTQILFIISGYLIFRSLDVEKVDTMQWLQRRFRRIYPSVWLALGVTVILLLAFLGDHEVSGTDWLSFLLAQGTVLQGYAPKAFEYFGFSRPNTATWIVAILIQWYLIAPFVIKAFRSLERNKLLPILIAVTFVSMLRAGADYNLMPTAIKVLDHTIWPQLHFFLLGASMYWFREELNRFFTGKWLGWLIGYLAFRYLGFEILYELFGFFWLDVFEELILVGLIMSMAFSNRGLSFSLLKGNQYASGIILYTMLVSNTLFLVAGSVHGKWIISGMSVAITLLLAYFQWHFFEKRFYNIPKGRNPYIRDVNQRK